jgi:hypothetical protein
VLKEHWDSPGFNAVDARLGVLAAQEPMKRPPGRAGSGRVEI